MRSWHGDCWNNAPEASGFSGPSMAIPVNKADERDESKRNRLLSPGGQKGFLRSRRKWMNPIPEKFANVLVSRVYLVERAGSQPAVAKSGRVHCNFAYSALACFRMGMSGSASFQMVKQSTASFLGSERQMILSARAERQVSCRPATSGTGEFGRI